MSMMAWGWDVISFVSGSRIVVRFGRSLALGWRPAVVLRLAWYRFGLVLYMPSSFFLSLSISFRFALLMIVEMALWHRAGMSSMLGGSVSWSIVETWVGVWVFSILRPGSGWLCDGCVFVSLLVTRRLASLQSFVRRLSCLLSEWVSGVCIFSGCCVELVCAIGQVFCASSWYVFSMLMMWSAALSILWGVTVWVFVSLAR